MTTLVAAGPDGFDHLALPVTCPMCDDGRLTVANPGAHTRTEAVLIAECGCGRQWTISVRLIPHGRLPGDRAN